MSRNHPTTRASAQHTVQATPAPPVADDQPMQDEGQEGYASSTPTSSLTWIAWFCSLPGHEYFCEVTEDFIEDDFNLTGLSAMVPFWKEAMEMVLDVEPEDTHRIPDVSIVEASAELLYGLVHQRYILTRPGLQAMAEKYDSGTFSTCLRVYCTSTRLLPCGRSDMPGVDTVKLFCPNCNDIYTPSSSRFSGVDGAFFGTTFAHLFFHTYKEYCPAPFIPRSRVEMPTAAGIGATERGESGGPITQINPNQYGGQKRPETRVYVPKIYGFKVSEKAKSGPRMGWLRMRPPTYEDLNAVDSKGRWVRDEDSETGRFDDDEDPDEPIDEDEEEEDDIPPPSAGAGGGGGWGNQHPPQGTGRRAGAGVGGRTRAAIPIIENGPSDEKEIMSVKDLNLQSRRRRLVRRPLPPLPEDSCSEDECDEESDEIIQSAEESGVSAMDSALDTPEDGHTSSVSQSSARPKRRKAELAALKVAKFVGKGLKDLFAGLDTRRGLPVEENVASLVVV